MLLKMTSSGLYCEAGDFFIDPWRPVDRAVITHGHGDHARWGSRAYLGSAEGARVLRTRLGSEAHIQSLDWSESIDIRGVRLSFHPAGHILGSAQVRVEYGGEVWVVSGDYKTEPDSTCTPFEPIRCHTFITESTFGLPVYRWEPQGEIFDQIVAWWAENREAGRASVLFGYALGKAQRLLAGLVGRELGPILTHGAVERLNADYRAGGIVLPETRYAGAAGERADRAGALVVAPPSASGSGWLRRFGDVSTAFASGWMRIRGTRRRRGVDRGFALSDHVDWPSLLAAIEATGASRVWVTHGYREPVVRWLREKGLESESIASHWEGEADDEGTEESPETGGDREDVATDALPALNDLIITGPGMTGGEEESLFGGAELVDRRTTIIVRDDGSPATASDASESANDHGGRLASVEADARPDAVEPASGATPDPSSGGLARNAPPSDRAQHRPERDLP